MEQWAPVGSGILVHSSGGIGCYEEAGAPGLFGGNEWNLRRQTGMLGFWSSMSIMGRANAEYWNSEGSMAM